jgi:hypothetical protein
LAAASAIIAVPAPLGQGRRGGRRTMGSLAMSMNCIRSRTRASLAWLLCLALLLPVAQSTALWHGVWHAAASAQAHDDGTSAPRSTPCDLCLVAAHLGSGAAFAAPPGAGLSTARHAMPRPATAAQWFASLVPAYRSRAPPVTSR